MLDGTLCYWVAWYLGLLRFGLFTSFGHVEVEFVVAVVLFSPSSERAAIVGMLDFMMEARLLLLTWSFLVEHPHDWLRPLFRSLGLFFEEVAHGGSSSLLLSGVAKIQPESGG